MKNGSVNIPKRCPCRARGLSVQPAPENHWIKHPLKHWAAKTASEPSPMRSTTAWIKILRPHPSEDASEDLTESGRSSSSSYADGGEPVVRRSMSTRLRMRRIPLQLANPNVTNGSEHGIRYG